VYAVDPKIMSKLEPQVRRVLIVDPNPAAARLLADLMRDAGAREVLFESDERHALEIADGANPAIIFVERSGPRLDGESFTRRLRRSDFECRHAPVIMVTGDATANTIKGARDAGVHEFLRKPFSGGDLMRRLEAVTLKPRDWIEAVQYVGPDRRRFNSAEYTGQRKRSSDRTQSPAEVRAQALDRALRILRSAIAQYDTDPVQARRALAQQAIALKQAAEQANAPDLAMAVTTLELALGQGTVSRATLSGPVKRVTDLFQPNAPVKAA
jgi:two-component system, response regulator PdtaR